MTHTDTTPRTRMLTFLRERYPDEDDEFLHEQLERMEAEVRWRKKQIVRLTCSKCGETKPTSAFRVRADSGTGFTPDCKACRSESEQAD